MRNFIIALILVTIAQVGAYFQLQSQFMWTWAKNNTIMMAFAGVPISILLIWFTHYCSIYFNGQKANSADTFVLYDWKIVKINA